MELRWHTSALVGSVDTHSSTRRARGRAARILELAHPRLQWVNLLSSRLECPPPSMSTYGPGAIHSIRWAPRYRCFSVPVHTFVSNFAVEVSFLCPAHFQEDFIPG